MPATKTRKIGPEIDAQLYEEMIETARQNGQSQRYVLERTLEFYLHNVESLGNHHGFPDGNKQIAFGAAATFFVLRGFYIDVGAADGYEFVNGWMERHEYRFQQIFDWLKAHVQPLPASDK